MIRIQPLNPSHLRELLELADGAFGAGYLTSDAVARCIDDPERVAWVALAGEALAGFLLGRLGTPDPRWLDGPVGSGFRAGILQTIAVSPHYMRRGIGTALTGHFTGELAAQCEAFYSVCWERGDAPFMRILDRAGWKPVKRLPGYWAEDSLQEGFVCAECGGPPCGCAAVIYRFGLGQSQGLPSPGIAGG